MRKFAKIGAFLLFATALAYCDPITYTFSGTGSGSLNGTSFNGASFSVNVFGDTGGIVFEPNLNAFGEENLSGTIDIAGLGTNSFSNPLFIFGGNGCNCLGFGEFVNGNLIAFFQSNLGLAGYDLKSNFGPVVGTDANLNQFQNVATSGGTLGYISMSDVTFVATANPVAEPNGLLLLGTGLAGMAIMLRRKLGSLALT